MKPALDTAPLAGPSGAKKGGGAKRERVVENGLRLAALGLESEFALTIDDVPARPEDVFGDPRSFLRGELMHRVGTSYHLHTGGAVYFDTGVIEVATPVIEIGRASAARAGRSLWEGILEVRAALDDWEARERREARLVGFSTHYNVSFELPRREQGANRTVEKLALLLSYIVPIPVMLLAANRESTGIGVRPRGDRIEVTADFTPSPSLMIATATLVVGIVREVMTWPSFGLETLEREGIPVVAGFRPIPHTSRKGWLARYTCFPANPFCSDIDTHLWPTRAHGELSLRELAGRIVRHFWRPIRRLSDPFTFRLIGSVIRGRAPSLLELDERPAEYADVGRLCRWDNLFPEHKLSRSLYERVLIRAIAGKTLRLGRNRYLPVRMQGWSRVVFRRENSGTLHTFPIDYLVGHLREWGEEG
jgi:hypothetical protein